jgi:osomolarity two-component system, sensor histidine kinase NIK1
MNGNMWVESELSQGSSFFFTLTSAISYTPVEATVERVGAAWANRAILFVDTLYDITGVMDRLAELPFAVHHVHEADPLKDKEKCPHIDTIITDSMEVVSSVRP